MATTWYAYLKAGMYERPEFEAPSREAADKIAEALGYDAASLHVTVHRHHGTSMTAADRGDPRKRKPSRKDAQLRELRQQNAELTAAEHRAKTDLESFRRLLASALELAGPEVKFEFRRVVRD